VPVTLVHGTADEQVPAAMSRAFGVGRLIEIPGAGHFDLIDPESPPRFSASAHMGLSSDLEPPHEPRP